jgi:chorismate dehydratase
VAAGLLPLADFFRLEETFERLGHFGLAVHGRVRSVMLFSCKPIRQLDGATIAITPETSTSAVLLRLILEKRYGIIPASYEDRHQKERRRGSIVPVAKERRRYAEADALLLIGDDALQFRQANTQYPYEIDLAFEWWLWQHLPCVFAVWSIRKDAPAQKKKRVQAALAQSLSVNLGQLGAIAQDYAKTMDIPQEELQAYLEGFHYRFGPGEEAGIKRFQELANEHHLL